MPSEPAGQHYLVNSRVRAVSTSPDGRWTATTRPPVSAHPPSAGSGLPSRTRGTGARRRQAYGSQAPVRSRLSLTSPPVSPEGIQLEGPLVECQRPPDIDRSAPLAGGELHPYLTALGITDPKTVSGQEPVAEQGAAVQAVVHGSPVDTYVGPALARPVRPDEPPAGQGVG